MATQPIRTREDRVAELMSRGCDTGEIAAHTGLTRGQVARSIQNIKRAVGLQAQ